MRSVHVRLAVCTQLPGMRSMVSLLLLQLGRLGKAQAGLVQLVRAGLSRRALHVSWPSRALRDNGRGGAARGNTIF